MGRDRQTERERKKRERERKRERAGRGLHCLCSPGKQQAPAGGAVGPVEQGLQRRPVSQLVICQARQLAWQTQLALA